MTIMYCIEWESYLRTQINKSLFRLSEEEAEYWPEKDKYS